jgi:hypothetical protein
MITGAMNEQNESNGSVNGSEMALSQSESAPVVENPTQQAARIGLIRIPAKLIRWKNIAESVDVTGAGPLIHKGAMLMSLEQASDLRDDLKKAIEAEKESIPKAALAGAYAAVMKAEAAYVKAVNDAMPAARRQDKPRRGFAKGAPMGPIDVKPS